MSADDQSERERQRLSAVETASLVLELADEVRNKAERSGANIGEILDNILGRDLNVSRDIVCVLLDVVECATLSRDTASIKIVELAKKYAKECDDPGHLGDIGRVEVSVADET